jgi:hypothetical protein
LNREQSAALLVANVDLQLQRRKSRFASRANGGGLSDCSLDGNSGGGGGLSKNKKKTDKVENRQSKRQRYG